MSRLGARRLNPSSDIGWKVVATPSGRGDMFIILLANPGCNTDGAVCSLSGSWLERTATTTIAGPTETPTETQTETQTTVP